MKESFTVGEEEMKEIARKVVSTLSRSHSGGSRVILLEGDLGAGKTTFTKALGKELGLNEEDVFSPTLIFSKLIHVDAYRFEDEREGDILKLEEDLEKDGNLVVIEWPKKMGWYDGDMRIHFKYNDEDTRDIYIDYEPLYEK
jgi:tRNA threonylcarbamoyladenosine biosynthesis protein TsaE